MSTAATASRFGHWSLILVLAFAAAAVLWFLYGALHYFADYSLDSYTEYFYSRRIGMIPHIFGGLLAITAGLVQIWLGLTHRTGKPHRMLGKVYGAGVLIGSLGGFYMVFTIPPGAMVYQAGLGMLCVAWVLTTSMALWAIRGRRLAQHRDWMLRSYVVSFGFVTVRLVPLFLRSWLDMPVGDAPDTVDALVAWACWSVPLLVAEPLIQLAAIRRGS